MDGSNFDEKLTEALKQALANSNFDLVELNSNEIEEVKAHVRKRVNNDKRK